MVILIDDFRDVKADLIARSSKEAKRVLADNKKRIDLLYIDHDLGCKENGYDVIVWMLRNNIKPSKITIVSSNPVGVRNIGKALENNGYTGYDGRNFSLDN